MSLISNLVHQRTASTGTGSLALSAQNGCQSFYSAFGSGGSDAFFYFISHRTMPEWEAGTGHMSNATTLVRDTVISSSNGNASVNFSAGDKDVVNDIDAGRQLVLPTGPAAGDLLYYNGSGWTRFARGSSGQFLSSGPTSVAWSALATVATTGAYNDLTGKPSLGSLAAKNSVDLGTSDAAGTLAAARFPALTGNVTTTAGSLTTSISAGAVTNAMLAGSIDLTSKVTNALPVANGGTGAATLTGIVKGNGTSAFTAATAGDFPTLNQSTTGNAATVTTNANLTGHVTSVDNATTIANGVVTGAMMSGTGAVRSCGITVDGGGVAPTTGSKGFATIPHTGTIARWYLAADQSGSIVIDVKRSGTSIVGSGNKPTLASAQSGNAAPSGWASTAITKGDIIEFNLNSASTCTRINLVLEVTIT